MVEQKKSTERASEPKQTTIIPKVGGLSKPKSTQQSKHGHKAKEGSKHKEGHKTKEPKEDPFLDLPVKEEPSSQQADSREGVWAL